MNQYPLVKVMHITDIRPAVAGGQLAIRLVWGDSFRNFRFEIDAFTYESLQKVLHFAEGYKYRLSFQSFKKEGTGQYYGMLSGVRDGDSVQIHFPCSEEFLSHLNWVKDLDSLEPLERLLKGEDPAPKQQVAKKFSTRSNPRFLLRRGVAVILLVFLFMNPGLLFQAGEEEIMEDPEQLLKPETSEVFASNEREKMDGENLLPEVYVLSTEKSIHSSLPKGYVALTFDDGPSVHTLQIAEVLQEYGVGATFFFIGKHVNRNPGITAKIADMGYVIGNHTHGHSNMRSINELKQLEEIENFNQQIMELTGKEVTLFRPPFGSYNSETRNVLDEQNMKTVLWNVDTKDWDNRTADEILKSIQDIEASGSILLLHETAQTLKALPKIIEYLLEQELRVVMLQ